MKLSKPSINLSLVIIISIAINYETNSLARTKETFIAQHQSVREQSSKSSEDRKLDFSGDGRPGRRTGGGSRSPCPASEMPLTALVPNTNTGTTVSDRPNLWFYVPYSPQQVSRGEFVLQDEQENDVYRQSFTLPETPGLVSLSVPPTAPPLVNNQTYRWYFKLYCGEDASSTAHFVEGWIKKITPSPDLATRLQDRAIPAYQVYGSESIWYDALNNLAQMRLANNNLQLERDWNQLLNSAGVELEKLSKESLIGEVRF